MTCASPISPSCLIKQCDRQWLHCTIHFSKAKFFGFGEVKDYIWKLFQFRNQKGLVLSWYCTSMISIFVHVCICCIIWTCSFLQGHLFDLTILLGHGIAHHSVHKIQALAFGKNSCKFRYLSADQYSSTKEISSIVRMWQCLLRQVSFLQMRWS